MQTRRSAGPQKNLRDGLHNPSAAKSGRARKGQPTVGSWRGSVDPRGRARWRQNGRNFTNGTFRGRSPLIKHRKNLLFPWDPGARKSAARAQSRQRIEFRLDNPTQRGRLWKDLVQTRRSAGPQKNLVHRLSYSSGTSSGPVRRGHPTSGFLARGCGPRRGRGRTGGTPRMALFAADPLL